MIPKLTLCIQERNKLCYLVAGLVIFYIILNSQHKQKPPFSVIDLTIILTLVSAGRCFLCAKHCSQSEWECETTKRIRRNKNKEQQKDREREMKKNLIFSEVSILYITTGLYFSPHYENFVLNYGKHFTAKRQAAILKWTALYTSVCAHNANNHNIKR